MQPTGQPGRLTLLSTDFKPAEGGVAEFAANLAEELWHQGALHEVITEKTQHQESAYPVYSTRLHDPLGEAHRLNAWRKLNAHARLNLRLFQQKQPGATVLITNVYEQRSLDFNVRLLQGFGIPYGLLFHGAELIRLTRDRGQSLRRMIAGAAFVVFNSRATQRLFGELGYTRPLQHVLYPGSHFERYPSLPKPARQPGDSLRIVSICRLVERKGLHVALKALAELPPELRGRFRWTIAGGGEARAALEQQVSESGLAGLVEFAGRISEAEKYRLLAAGDLFLMPNLTLGGADFEGFGISFVEAAFYKNAIIGGRNGGVAEAVGTEEDAGILLDLEGAQDSPKITSVLERFARGEINPRAMGERAHAYVTRHYAMRPLVADFLRFIERHMGRHRATRAPMPRR